MILHGFSWVEYAAVSFYKPQLRLDKGDVPFVVESGWAPELLRYSGLGVGVKGNWGFALVPMKIVEAYCQQAKATKNPDGTVRHYHALISPEPDPELYWSNDIPKYNLSEYCQIFD